MVDGKASEKSVTAVTDFNTSGSDWKTAVFKPATSSEANNIYSIQLKLSASGVDTTFAINDINISYRKKQIK